MKYQVLNSSENIDVKKPKTTAAYCCRCFDQSHISSKNQVQHAQVLLTWDWQLSGPQLVWNRPHPTLSMIQTDKLPTEISACPSVWERMVIDLMTQTLKQSFFLYDERLCFMYFTQFDYKTPREWLLLSTLWKTKINHCLFSFCWSIVLLCLVTH